MGAKNDPRMVEFKGWHPYFVEGTFHNYNDYANYTQEHCPLGGVIASTMKGRLSKVRYCEPKHLKHVDEYAGSPLKGSGWCKEAREKALQASRFENDTEALSMKWLKIKLVGG